jgi:cell division protein FtsW
MKQHFDYFLFFLVAGLIAFGFMFFSGLSVPVSMQNTGEPNYYLWHQLFFGILPAIICGFIAYKIPLDFLRKYSFVLVSLNIFALFLVFLPFIGLNAGGASRWLNLGFFAIQPSEFLKITSILYLSAWVCSKIPEHDSIKSKISTSNKKNIIHTFLPFIAFLALIFAALFLQRDASTLGIISITLLTIYFSAKTAIWHSFTIILGGLLFLFSIVIFEPYRFNRWLTFLNPDSDPLGIGFQVKQSLIALGSGGIFGKGLGLSVQKFGFLPQAMSDSIFAVIGEELGIIGCIALICAFILFFWRGIKIENTDRFSKMVAVGIVFWITLQAFINISSAAGIFPLAGIPLPFFSYGGSHLMVELIGVGLLLKISKA